MGCLIGTPTWYVKLSDFTQTHILTGTYVGNGVDDRNIDIGVNLAAKNNVYVIVKITDLLSIQKAVARSEFGQGDVSFCFDTESPQANMIQAFTATGFEIGDAIIINANGFTYMYAAFWEEP